MHFLSLQDAVTAEGQYNFRAVTKSKAVWNGHTVDMIKGRIIVINGQEPVVREYARHPDAVTIVVPRDESGGEKLLLQHQHRYPVKAGLWEVPAGLLDIPGKNSRIVAKRKLAEEADLIAECQDALVGYFIPPGSSTEPLCIFLVHELHDTVKAFGRESEEAAMEYAWVNLDGALTMVLDGRLHNLSTVVNILTAHAVRVRGQTGIRTTDASWPR